MKRLLTWVCLFGFLASLVGEAAAEDKKPEKKKRDVEAVFKKLDADSDGKLTVAEFKGKKKGKALERAEKIFARLDKDKNGSVSLEEFKNRGKKPKKNKGA